MIDDRKIPDPFKITHGWQTEEEGMVFWPMIPYPDVSSYVVLNHPSKLSISISKCSIFQSI